MVIVIEGNCSDVFSSLGHNSRQRQTRIARVVLYISISPVISIFNFFSIFYYFLVVAEVFKPYNADG